MSEVFSVVDKKKAALDKLRPLQKEQLDNLEAWFKVELTYHSNAIEGNTLTKDETALVVEKGITVGGKSLKEHLEATNYAFALDYVKKLSQKTHEQLMLAHVLALHQLVLKGIDDKNAGKFRSIEVKIAGSDTQLPQALRVPDLMYEFMVWLTSNNDHPVKRAADAHFRLVAIHPFVDGNGRAARLLLGLLLMQEGYPPALIRNEHRLAYINAIRETEQTGDFVSYYAVIATSVESSLDVYLDLLDH